MSLPKCSICKETVISIETPKVEFECALLTSVGRSAVAVIGVRGQDLQQRLAKCFQPATAGAFLTGQVRYGTWCCGENDDAESVVIVPLSNTELEINSHGGIAAPTRIISDLRGLGAFVCDQQDWNHGESGDLLIAEATQHLCLCQTTRFAAVLMDQVRGAMKNWATQQLQRLAKSADESLAEVQADADRVSKYGCLGLKLSGRFDVVIAGPPNVGKSSLINAILGYERSITMDMAGTTRDVLHAETVINGIPIRLSDTAGMRDSSESIEKQGVEKAKRVAATADLLVLVRDHKSGLAVAPPSGVPVLTVQNKSDLSGTVSGDAISTSATRGDGVPELMAQIEHSLARFPNAGSPVPINARQMQCLRAIAESSSVDEARRGLQDLLGKNPPTELEEI